MFRALQRWLFSHFAYRRLSTAEYRLAVWTRDSEQIQQRFLRHRKKLEALNSRLLSVGETLLEDLDESERLLKRHTEALEGASAELSILKELTVPGLTMSHQLMVQRAEADIAVQVRKQVMHQSVEE